MYEYVPMGIVICISNWPGFSDQDGTYLVGYQTTHPAQRTCTDVAMLSAPSSRSLNLSPRELPVWFLLFVKPRLPVGIHLRLVTRVAAGQ